MRRMRYVQSSLGFALTAMALLYGLLVVQAATVRRVYRRNIPPLRSLTRTRLALRGLRRAYARLERRLSEQLAEISALDSQLRREIADRQRIELRLRHDSLHDSLTGLPNRVFVLRRLARFLEHTRRFRDQRFAILLLDLDCFKLINDSLGHLIGDQVLVLTARRLEECLRGGDTVARLGGDEFLIVLDMIDELADAVRVADRVHHALAAPIIVEGQEVFTTTSIGIMVATPDYQTPEDLLRDADNALYRAKARGRGRTVLFDTLLHEHAVALFQLETDLRYAVERQEFLLYYQPIVELPAGRICGFEALIRWQHPARGLLPPSAFLDAAEECGLSVMIGGWVLHEACRQLVAWESRIGAAPQLTINVNLSHRQLTSTLLPTQVLDALEVTGLAPSQLCLEITESVMLADRDVLPVLEQLRQLGVQLHIDDFGTGYSSLSVLHELPIDVLKIDRSFVNALDNTDGRHVIARTIVLLARELGLKVIAEGIERRDQADTLARLGSDYGQGFWFARPLDPTMAERLLQEHA